MKLNIIGMLLLGKISVKEVVVSLHLGWQIVENSPRVGWCHI